MRCQQLSGNIRISLERLDCCAAGPSRPAQHRRRRRSPCQLRCLSKSAHRRVDEGGHLILLLSGRPKTMPVSPIRASAKACLACASGSRYFSTEKPAYEKIREMRSPRFSLRKAFVFAYKSCLAPFSAAIALVVAKVISRGADVAYSFASDTPRISIQGDRSQSLVVVCLQRSLDGASLTALQASCGDVSSG